jgi:hypothetical protein
MSQPPSRTDHEAALIEARAALLRLQNLIARIEESRAKLHRARFEVAEHQAEERVLESDP